MSTYLYDTPWWLLALLIGAGALFGWSGFSRRDRPLMILGLVLLTAGVGLFVTSRLVETDTEQVVRRTSELIASVERKDWSATEALLDPAATAAVPMVGRQFSSRDEIIAAARSYGGRAGSFSLNLQRVEVKPEGPEFVTNATVYIAGDQFTQLTVWQFRWHKQGGQWVATSADPIQVGLQPGNQRR